MSTLDMTPNLEFRLMLIRYGLFKNYVFSSEFKTKLASCMQCPLPGLKENHDQIS